MTVHDDMVMTTAGAVAARMAAIADTVAAPAAADVDERGRFPSETMARCRQRACWPHWCRWNSAGGGATLTEVSAGPGGPRQALCLQRHGRGHAPHPGGLPRPSRP